MNRYYVILLMASMMSISLSTLATISLHEVARAGNVAEVKRLLDGGNFDVNVQDPRGKTILMDAAERGDGALIIALHKYNPNYAIRDNQRWTARQYALSRGYPDLAEWLTP